MPSIQLAKEQRVARDVFAALLENLDESDRRYDSLAESHGGRIVSTDLARFLDVRYRDVPSGQPRDLVPGWDLAWRYSQDRFKRELARRGHRKIVRFMAGGWGAGKTHTLEGAEDPDLAWDGTLKDKTWAREMIGLALSNGWQIEVAYIFRDIELALYGVVERAAREGRGVPLVELPDIHRKVQRSILSLIREYEQNTKVSFLLLHNIGDARVNGSPKIFQYTELARGGALHYSPRHESYYAQIALDLDGLNSGQNR